MGGPMTYLLPPFPRHPQTGTVEWWEALTAIESAMDAECDGLRSKDEPDAPTPTEGA